MKPEIKEVLEIQAMKEDANRIYEEIDIRVSRIKDEFGAGRFDYELPEGENTPYLKLEITDNIKELSEGGSVWKSTIFKPVAFSTRGLKRCPASLKAA